MLSRTADHLFWMARYMERAENTARMLDVCYRVSLMPQSPEEAEQNWIALLRIMSLEPQYRETCGEVEGSRVLRFMIFDPENPSSIRNCLRAARENAHAVRDTLTAELWETMNATWIKVRGLTPEIMEDRGVGEFFEWVKYRSHLSRGVTIGTMLQDEAWRFIRLGTFLERADNTARILDVKYQVLVTEDDEEDADYHRWSALLHSVSAFEVYRKVYRDLISPVKVAELLILNPLMPRSLARCVREVFVNLQEVANDRSAETIRRAGELEASLRFGRVDVLIEQGLHPFLDRFMDRIYDLGNRISDDFLIPVRNTG
ncbi:MAG: alpha-E domain-containing protein [Rhodocyclaceae bacterium]|nr:alpha-E domain-containing protein [Rhodocyclaceae bacterium]